MVLVVSGSLEVLVVPGGQRVLEQGSEMLSQKEAS